MCLTWFCLSLAVQASKRRWVAATFGVLMCGLSGVFGSLFHFNFYFFLSLWALCPLWHEISRSRAPHWLWLTVSIWANVKLNNAFLFVCAHVWIIVHRHTKGNKCNQNLFEDFCSRLQVIAIKGKPVQAISKEVCSALRGERFQVVFVWV